MGSEDGTRTSEGSSWGKGRSSTLASRGVLRAERDSSSSSKLSSLASQTLTRKRGSGDTAIVELCRMSPVLGGHIIIIIIHTNKGAEMKRSI